MVLFMYYIEYKKFLAEVWVQEKRSLGKGGDAEGPLSLGIVRGFSLRCL